MGILIKEIGPNDVPKILHGAKEFIEDAKITGGFVEESFLRHWSDAIRFNMGKVWVLEVDGEIACGIGGYTSPDPNNGDYVFTEAFFYAMKGKEGHGHKLLKNVEKFLEEELGISRIYMFSRTDYLEDRVATLYHKMGYTPKEIFWEKSLEQKG